MLLFSHASGNEQICHLFLVNLDNTFFHIYLPKQDAHSIMSVHLVFLYFVHQKQNHATAKLRDLKKYYEKSCTQNNIYTNYAKCYLYGLGA